MTRQSAESAPPARMAILEAALGLLGDEGPTALRVRRVAAEAGCSTMGVYTHFQSKDGLVEALWLHCFEEFGSMLSEVPRTGGSLTRLRRLALAYRRWGLEHPSRYLLMFGRSVPEFVPGEASRAQAAVTFEILVEAVRVAQEERALRAGAEAQAAQAIWAVCHGLVMIDLAGVAPPSAVGDADASYRAGVDAVLGGLSHSRRSRPRWPVET